MVVVAGAAAAASVAGGSGVGLFSYNRKNFLYDRKLRQETEYQIMDFKIRQAELWREDIKDIIGLTSVKMDTYLIVTAVQLGFCVMAFCEGRLAAGTPAWLIGAHTLCLAGSFLYLLMSVWLAMHASVSAKAYEVRLLTQHVRLPVPTWTELEGARTYASSFEKVNTSQMLRMPFIMGKQEDVLGRGCLPGSSRDDGVDPNLRPGAAAQTGTGNGTEASNAKSSSDLWGLEAFGSKIQELDGTARADPRQLRHLRLVHEAMQYWQSYDGFARVTMSLGTNQLITALAYYVIAYVLVSNRAVVACWLTVLLFMVIVSALIRLDMSLTSFEYRLSVVLVSSGPIISTLAAHAWLNHKYPSDEMVLTPLVYISHALWLLFLVYICKVSEQRGGAMLPTGFRSVMYIDIFGWIKALPRLASSSPPASLGTPLSSEPPVPGKGPALQAVQYENGRPVPTRPEQLPGASRPAPAQIRREDFEPATFIPRLMDEAEDQLKADEADRQDDPSTVFNQTPGTVPYRLFLTATGLLIVLWFASGICAYLRLMGLQVFEVAPLLREEVVNNVIPEKQNLTLMQDAVLEVSQSNSLPTSWPRPFDVPQQLSCYAVSHSPSSSTPPAILFTAVTHFGLLEGELDQHGSTPHVALRDAPACMAIEGDALRDVGISCSSTSNGGVGHDCFATVLHGQGHALTPCPLGKVPGARALPSSLRIADDWLEDVTSNQDPSWQTSSSNKADASEQLQEEVQSFASPNEASSKAFCSSFSSSSSASATTSSTARSSREASQASPVSCTLVRTSSERLMELASNDGVADDIRDEDKELTPRRMLKQQKHSKGTSGLSSVRMLGPVGNQYLAVLPRGSQTLDLLDPATGSKLGELSLGMAARSICAVDKLLFVLRDDDGGISMIDLARQKHLTHFWDSPSTPTNSSLAEASENESTLEQKVHRHLRKPRSSLAKAGSNTDSNPTLLRPEAA